MSDMKCPFCGEKLYENKPNLYDCRKVCCNKTTFMNGTKELWQELIRTRKALDVAVDALKVYANPENWDFEHFYSLDTHDIADDALEQITALEQKD